MKYQYLVKSLLLGLATSAPAAPPVNDLDVAMMQSCSDKPHPTLVDYNIAGVAWCEKHVRANAPNPPMLPKPIIDPMNPPVIPPLRAPYTFMVPNPDKKKPGFALQPTFEILGFTPITREMCLLGWGVGSQSYEIQLEQVKKGNICRGQGGIAVVQGWNQTIWWNEFGIVF
jgi:hypothetical protein